MRFTDGPRLWSVVHLRRRVLCANECNDLIAICLNLSSEPLGKLNVVVFVRAKLKAKESRIAGCGSQAVCSVAWSSDVAKVFQWSAHTAAAVSRGSLGVSHKVEIAIKEVDDEVGISLQAIAHRERSFGKDGTLNGLLSIIDVLEQCAIARRLALTCSVGTFD